MSGWQLIIFREPRNGEAAGSVRTPRNCRRYELDHLPFTLSPESGAEDVLAPGCSLRIAEPPAPPVPGLPQLLLYFEGMSASPDERSETPVSPASLGHGGTLRFDNGTTVRLYQSRKHPGMSPSAGAMSCLAKCGIALVMSAELLSIALVPLLPRQPQLFAKHEEIQELSYLTDQIRLRLKRLEPHSPALRSCAELMRSELNERVRYLRRNAGSLTADERKRQMDNLKRLAAVLRDIENAPGGRLTDEALSPDLDPVIEQITGEQAVISQ